MQSVAQFAAYVGIDVSAHQLDVHVLPTRTSFRLPNTRSGIWDLISRLAEMDEVLFVLEVAIQGGDRRVFARQHAPLASGAQCIEDDVEDGAHVGGALPPTGPGQRDHRLDQGPLLIRQIGRVQAGHRTLFSL
ncbi:hypothetical protein TSO352_05030 [Azospirillum sp. TSO35-2]|nr:hypothetical protein TSO352_05030 [Azospirillum sp. TSO35-2]